MQFNNQMEFFYEDATGLFQVFEIFIHSLIIVAVHSCNTHKGYFLTAAFAGIFQYISRLFHEACTKHISQTTKIIILWSEEYDLSPERIDFVAN